MSRTPLYWIEKKNKETGKWEDVNLYVKDGDEYKPWLWDTGNADHALFDLLFEKFDGAVRRIPDDLAPSAAHFFDDPDPEVWGGIERDMRQLTRNAWYDLVELRLLAQTKNAMVYNIWHEDDSEEPEYINGLTNFLEKIEFICDANEIWYPNPGDVRIICALE